MAFGQISFKDSNTVDGPIITFDSLVVDYGDISNKENYRNEIRFTNTGNEPLIIAYCKTSCGCLVASCSREPILPFESSSIEFQFYTLNRNGPFSKAITLSCNAYSKPIVLLIKGNVTD